MLEAQNQTLDAIRATFKAMDENQLRAAFEDGLRLNRDVLLRHAAILLEMESRALPVSGNTQYLAVLRRIGRGETLVDVVVRFGCHGFMRRIARMPIAKQIEYLEASDADIAAEFSRRSKTRRRSQQQTAIDGAAFDLSAMAKNASIKDVVEMCADLVRHSIDPWLTADLLLEKLESLKRRAKPARVG